ncbi:MAG: type II toxin-antitoxin system HicA family toxin [Candidatus Schekmanbacteria bacterium]|nr:MAG: type II toxin-antitoxin system HicA family toxin [Candidatus Schekmanbacteria bacterium]
MGKYEKLRLKILSGEADQNIRFADLCQLLKQLGFEERIKGDPHIFSRYDVEEILNLQPRKGKAKPYQVKQVRNLILKYKLSEAKDD